MNSNEDCFDLDGRSLSKYFDEAVKSFEDICNSELPTNSSDMQYKVKKCMALFENITRMVSSTGMFSANESINEVATNDLKFMLLPSYLGTLLLKLTSGDRKDIVLTAEIYFKDFLQRCKDYELTDVDIVIVNSESEECMTAAQVVQRPPSEHACPNTLQDLMGMGRARAEKIKQYRQQKELESRLETLKVKLDLSDGMADEELKRDYYLSLIKSHINKAVDELDCLQSEKIMLSRSNRRSANVSAEDETDSSTTTRDVVVHNKRHHPKYKPLQPVIITRDEIQKKVFGAGYPSLPTMTVDELCQQRLKDGTWDNSQPSLDMAKNEELKKSHAEQDVVYKELAIDNDDPEVLQRMRNMDEYKDTHKRGWGNRYNRS